MNGDAIIRSTSLKSRWQSNHSTDKCDVPFQLLCYVHNRDGAERLAIMQPALPSPCPRYWFRRDNSQHPGPGAAGVQDRESRTTSSEQGHACSVILAIINGQLPRMPRIPSYPTGHLLDRDWKEKEKKDLSSFFYPRSS